MEKNGSILESIPENNLLEESTDPSEYFDLTELNEQYLSPSLEEKIKLFNNQSTEILRFLQRKAYYFYNGREKAKFQEELRDELVNASIHKCALKLSEYDPNKGSLANWASTIMHNTFIDMLREKSRRPVLNSLEGLEYEIEDRNSNPSEMIFNGYGLQEAVLENIINLKNENQISEDDALILREALFNEKNYAEIAQILGMTNSNKDRQVVRRHYLKALSLLRDKLAKESRFADLLTT